MKRIYLLMLTILFIGNVSAYAGDDSGFDVKMDDKAHIGLFLAFSGVDSKTEDDNVALEIYDQCVWLKNKTEKTLYLNLAECFIEIYGETQSLYLPDKTLKTKQKGKTSQDVVQEEQWFTVAPGKEESIAYIGTGYYGTYSAYEGKDVRVLNDVTREFMQAVDEMRIEIEKGANSVTRHLTQDESFTRIKAMISYRFSSKQEDATSIAAETWLSDITLSKYYILFPPKQEKERSLAAKKVKPAMVCVSAKQPFEYDKEKSPIIGCDIKVKLKKGEFTLDYLPTSKITTNFFRLLSSVYTYGLISPIKDKNKNRFDKLVINWLGDSVDFSKIDDDDEGTATFGKKKNKITITNK